MTRLLLLGCIFFLSVGPLPADELKFKTQEIDTGLNIGYAVTLADVDGDKKLDIVVVDTERVIWFQNPTWQKRVIIQGGTKRDNVTIAPYDVDGDGQIDFALGAGWKPFDTKVGGTLQWLKRGKTLDDPWSIYPIDEEPMVHRIRFADIDGDGKAELISVPLMGRGATEKNNWMDGSPVRITAYRIPKDPLKERWQPTVLDESLHVVHNFHAIDGPGKQPILFASYEGVSVLAAGGDKAKMFGSGNQDNPKGKRGASEVRQGRLAKGMPFVATVEPWHGNQVVVYLPQRDGTAKRHVIDGELQWGHAVACADLDGDGSDELIAGIRDDKDKTWRRGVRVYHATDALGTTWERQIVDAGGVAVEDITVGDLNGDGRIDIVAVGRQTHNVRIYWNEKK